MDGENVDRLIAEASELNLRLLDVATNLLKHLDTTSPPEMAEQLRTRQNIIEALQKIDRQLGPMIATEGSALANFRAFQEKTIKSILEVDGLVIALASQKQAAIKNKFVSFKRSKVAVQAYQNRISTAPHSWLNDMM